MELRELIIDFLNFFLELFNREGSTVFLRICFGLQEFHPTAFEIDLLSLLRSRAYRSANPIRSRRPSPRLPRAEEFPRRIRGIRLGFTHIEHLRPWIEIGEIRCPLFG